MYLLAALIVLSIPTLTVQTPCPDENVKKLLVEHQVTTDITSLLAGRTFTDIWRRKQTADQVDCAMIEFTLKGNVLKAELRNVGKDGSPDNYFEVWTEVKGQGKMDARGQYVQDAVMEYYTEQYNIFYADEYAYGYFSCGCGDGYVRMSISSVKDKEEDAEGLVSLGKAKAIMDKFQSIMPEPMVELSRTRCPGNGQEYVKSMNGK